VEPSFKLKRFVVQIKEGAIMIEDSHPWNRALRSGFLSSAPA
jgi:hypothetical protein